MRMTNYEYRDFVPQFLGWLFEPGERVRIAYNLGPDNIRNERLERDAAAERLLRLELTPNIYFAPSALDGESSFTQANCLHTRTVCLDIDYGSEGHKEAAYLDTLDDAYACVMTAPLRPACVWGTGHGLQVMYRLADPFNFRGDADPAARIKQYTDATRKLAAMLQGDAAFTPEHLFRVPMSMNAKPGLPIVTGRILFVDEGAVHDWSSIVRICSRYDVSQPEPKQSISDTWEDEDALRIDIPYEQLPADLRTDIEDRSPRDRSRAMYRIIARMDGDGYAETVIRQAITKHFDVPERYQGRLDEEISRCLKKVRGSLAGAYVVDAPIDLANKPNRVRLDDCPPLSQEMQGMLDRYGQTAGIAVAERVRTAARFHEHLFAQHSAGVMETPCGYGKSTWALCRIALRANPSEPYLYVVDTLGALHRAADMLQKLNPNLLVGRYHGFDEERCLALSGKKLDWKQCSPTNPERACKRCTARDRCEFFNRDRELQQDAVVMCHNGLVRLLERQPDSLRDRNVIVDEDLNAFLTVEFKLKDLQLVQQYLTHVDAGMEALLPFTRFGACGKVALQPGCRSFAGLNYVFRDETETAALAPTVAAMRKGFGAGFLDPFKHKPEAIDHAQHVLLELISFFRPSARGDACYAYRELQDRKGIRYVCKKSRFNFGAGIPSRRLWILNASAQLAATPYPDDLAVYTCPELTPNSPLVILHVIQGNPMQKKLPAYIDMAARIIRDICGAQGRPAELRHKVVFVATDKRAAGLREIEQAVHDGLGPDVTITVLPRGRIRGSNAAGDCTLACLATMSFFTTIDNVALSTVFNLRRTLPIRHVFTKSGGVCMPGGRFRLAAMRPQFALSALDEIYQTLYRGAVRNDRPLEAIVVMPDAEWLVLLWRTVLPGFRFNAVYTVTDRGFKVDDAMSGLLGLLATTSGDEITKSDVATRLGYSQKTGWKDKKNRARIKMLLEPFFEEGSSVQELRRRQDE